MKIITFASIKGGVGKTSCSIFLAQALSQRGRRVLAVDLDGNPNLSDYFLASRSAAELKERNVRHVLLGASRAEEVIYNTSFSLDTLPSVPGLGKYLAAEHDAGILLRFPSILRRLDYDYVIIDTPPSHTDELLCGLYAADLILVPVLPSKWTVDAYVLVLDELSKVQEAIGKLIPLSVVASCVTDREAELIHAETRWNSLKTAISRSAAVRNACNRSYPLKNESKSFQQFSSLAEELEAIQ